jgi:hypothetical protein
LADRDGRSNAFDLVDIRFFHAIEELAGIRRQRLDIAALAFGVDRVENERGLPGAGDTRHHRKLEVRKLQGQVLEIVNACTAYDD